MAKNTPFGFTQKSFAFLEDLEENNDKTWFDDNRSVFDEKLKQPFEALLADLSDRLEDADLPLRGSSKTMFRMNRDVRFSKDKRPYKTSVSGVLTRDGTKGASGPLLYVELSADGGFTGTGLHKLSPTELQPIRTRMVKEPQVFDGVKGALASADRSLETSDQLTAMPRGFEPYAEHRHADAIRLKSLLISEPLPKSAWLSGDVADRVEQLARDAMPLLRFCRDALA
ncbi:MAG: DUF2461 domain-containing protein [Pseudomonadota bacterium]